MKLDVTAPDVGQMIERDILAAERSVSAAMRGAAQDIKDAWRAEIRDAGLGDRLANTVRAQVYPQGEPSLNAAALIWTRAPRIVAAHEQGGVIRSPNGLWLAIPLPTAGAGRRGGRITPLEYERRRGVRLRMVYRRGKSALLVADDARISSRGVAVRKGGRRRRDGILTGAQSVPVFVLVPQATLPKRTDLVGAADDLAAGVAAQIGFLEG
jgi:hypothetical protein